MFSAIRDRYDGKKRNPFNEGEFGHRYGRAMASYSGLLVYTGFEFRGVDQSLAFKNRDGKFFWSNGYQYGTVEINTVGEGKRVALTVLNGELLLESFSLKELGEINF